MSLSLMELAEHSPDITISIKLSDLIEANKALIKATREELEKQVRDEQSEEYMTIEQVAELLKVEKTTLWRWNKSGYLVRFDVGGQKRYKKSDVHRLLKK